MTQAIRDAAQALYVACCGYGCMREQDIRDATKALGAAISAPQPTADERLGKLLDATQALLDAKERGNPIELGIAWSNLEAARGSSLVENHPLHGTNQCKADKLVAEHMRFVQAAIHAFAAWCDGQSRACGARFDEAFAAVKESARALLSASQEDAGRQARLVELVLHMAESKRLRDWEDFHIDLSEAISIAQALKEPK